MRAAAALTIALLLALPACGSGRETVRRVVHVVPERHFPRVPDRAEGKPVAWVRVAADPDTRQRGLMFVEGLEPDRGMLFVYPEPRKLRFWMKNVHFPLSICFADPAGRIVRILEMKPLRGGEEDPPTYDSLEPAVYALEMNQGWFRAKGIRIGDELAIHPEILAMPIR
jgi:uncharacterized membrane protein (UPF0127 family)